MKQISVDSPNKCNQNAIYLLSGTGVVIRVQCLRRDKRRFDHITPVLDDLLWLPVSHRITFKLASLAYKTIHTSQRHTLILQYISIDLCGEELDFVAKSWTLSTHADY